jgi:DNA-binding beta-propeller fold protein YncE
VGKKALLTAIFISMLLFLTIAGTEFVKLGTANPVGAELKYTAPPVILIHSPVNNETLNRTAVSLQFIVSKPQGWLIHGGSDEAKQMFKGLSYELDGKMLYNTSFNSDLKYPFYRSVNLNNLKDGVHSVKVSAYASGWCIEMHRFWKYEVAINSSAEVYFSVDTTYPTISILPDENNAYGTSDKPLNFTVNEPVSRLFYSLDGQENVTISGNTTLANLSCGDHTVTVYAMDKAGNIASETIICTISMPEQREPAPFPTELVATASGASVAIIGVGLLVYLMKRKR